MGPGPILWNQSKLPEELPAPLNLLVLLLSRQSACFNPTPSSFFCTELHKSKGGAFSFSSNLSLSLAISSTTAFHSGEGLSSACTCKTVQQLAEAQHFHYFHPFNYKKRERKKTMRSSHYDALTILHITGIKRGNLGHVAQQSEMFKIVRSHAADLHCTFQLGRIIRPEVRIGQFFLNLFSSGDRRTYWYWEGNADDKECDHVRYDI